MSYMNNKIEVRKMMILKSKLLFCNLILIMLYWNYSRQKKALHYITEVAYPEKF